MNPKERINIALNRKKPVNAQQPQSQTMRANNTSASYMASENTPIPSCSIYYATKASAPITAATPSAPALPAGVAAAFLVTEVELALGVVVVMTLVVVLLEREVTVEEPDLAVMVATMTTVRVNVEVTSWSARTPRGMRAKSSVEKRILRV
jgi:hypothetical protein